VFVVIKNRDGGRLFLSNDSRMKLNNHSVTELITPPLDGMILPGITRDSVLTLAREHTSGVKRLPHLPNDLIVSERPVTMKEVIAASQSGSLVELFGSGECPAANIILPY
jgi:branched-subunit amino acid aminotransferase/4-amino-4-deoxychorismate lyase